MQTFIGRTPTLLLCCAAFWVQIAHAQSAASPAPSTTDGMQVPESRPVSRTLTDLGHESGLRQTGADGSIRFTMPMPLDTSISGARLVLHYSTSSTTPPGSTLQVSLNGSVREVAELSDAGRAGTRSDTSAQSVLSLPLTGEDLRLPFLDVDLRARFGLAEERCNAPDGAQHFLNLLPQTALSYRARSEPAPSVRGFLSTLPTNSRIAIAPGSGDEALRTSWLITRELQQRGHRVSYTHPGEGGDILIGPPEVLAEHNASLPEGASFGLVTPDPEQPFRFQLAVTEPYQSDALAAPWNLLLGAQGYDHGTAASPSHGTGAPIELAALGLDTDARAFTGSSEWTFSTRSLAAGLMPTALRLDLVVPPSTSDDPLVLYVLQNDSLRGLVSLDHEGGEQTVTVSLGPASGPGGHPLRLVLMRQSSTDCSASPTSGFAQIQASSVLETRTSDTLAETIADYARQISAGFSLHLPVDASDHPLAWSRTLSGLGRSLGLDPRLADLRTTDMAPPENRPFIWFGAQPPPGFASPVAIDRGRVQVRQHSGEVLLDSGAMPDTSMISLLRNGSQRGLWLRTLGEGIPASPPGLERSTGDLVFGDQNGVLISLAAGSDSVVGLAYPEHASWADTAARYRVWLFGLLWAVLTIVVIAVTRRMRKNQT
jgi:cellulose synthase operon protein B